MVSNSFSSGFLIVFYSCSISLEVRMFVMEIRLFWMLGMYGSFSFLRGSFLVQKDDPSGFCSSCISKVTICQMR